LDVVIRISNEGGGHIKKADLIDRSIRALGDFHIEKIWQAGIRRDSLSYHPTVMYPPLKAMDTTSGQQIYSHFTNKSKDFTIYVHIPFCSGECTFCYFYQIENPANEIIAAYLDALKKEIKITGKKIADHLGRVQILSVFFGGGSPTILSKAQFEDLISTIKQHFDIAEGIEITVEIHPEIMRSGGRPLLECYFANGVNRLNVGVQSFDDTLLRTANRRHTAAEGIAAFELAREIGFRNINLDLLYPLPDLTPEIWEKTLDTAFELEPESVTTYFTAIRKPSLMYELLRRHPDRFPNEYMNHLFRIMAMEKAKEKGYDHGKLVDWFVKPQKDFHYKHQKSEVKGTEEIQLLSFGSGAFTYLNFVQFFNYPDIRKYCELLAKDSLPVWRGMRLTEEERVARAMVLGMKSGEVNVGHIEKRLGVSVFNNYRPLLGKLEALELVEIKNDVIRLSEKGMLFADEVAVQFITENVRTKASGKSNAPESEHDLIEAYNFMYDVNELTFL
jgi:oxygen-independent coproporphyrinogen III oxidase